MEGAPDAQSRIRLAVMPGDGIGPEITAATLNVLHAADRRLALGLSFDTVPIGLAALQAHGSRCRTPRLRSPGTPTA